jgi:arylsulfatase A-like enzyme
MGRIPLSNASLPRLLPLVGLSLLAAAVIFGALWLGRQPTPIPGGGRGSGGTAQDGGLHVSSWPVAFDFAEDAEPRYDRVVLVTIDTLRADHVSAYGYKRKTTPFFDALSKKGALFRNAVAAVSHTAPSHASMLTGLPPAVHGVTQNGQPLDHAAADLGSVFNEAEYETAAFLSVNFLSGITWSFDHVDVKLHSGGLVADSAISWLRTQRDNDRFFLWVHLYDPHRWKEVEKAPPAELAALRGGKQEDDEQAYAYLAKLHGLPSAEGDAIDLGWNPTIKGRGTIETPTRRDYLDLIDAYDAMVLFADRQVMRLYQAIEDLNLPGSTLWVITSDHGEGLASHQVAGHGGRIYQEQLHVPLLIHATDGSIKKARIARLVQLIDLFPTLAGVADARLYGLDPMLYGASLWPLLDGKDGWIDRPAFTERKPLEQPIAGEPDGMYAMQTDRHKYILHVPGEDEFFDLRGDPGERVNLIEAPSRERDALQRLLSERIEIFRSSHRAPAGEIPQEWIEELRDLGYVQ